MKLTKSKLKQLIREEIEAVLEEQERLTGYLTPISVPKNKMKGEMIPIPPRSAPPEFTKIGSDPEDGRSGEFATPEDFRKLGRMAIEGDSRALYLLTKAAKLNSYAQAILDAVKGK